MNLTSAWRYPAGIRFFLDQTEFVKTNEIKSQSEAVSLSDVQGWTFDVGCSVFAVLDILGC